MSDLASQTPANTYKGLLQVNDYTNGVDATAKYVQDGEGTNSALAISTTKVGIGTESPSAILHLDGGSSNLGGLLLGHAGGVGIDSLRLYIDANNKAHITRGSSDKLTIDSAGKVGIGTASPGANLHIFDASAGNGEFLGLVLSNYDYGVGETSQSVAIEGRVKNGGGGDSPVAKLVFGKDSNFSDVNFRDGNLQFHVMTGDNGTATFSEKMRIKSDGTINFSSLSTYANDSAAGTGGLVAGDVYKTSTGELRIKV